MKDTEVCLILFPTKGNTPDLAIIKQNREAPPSDFMYNGLRYFPRVDNGWNGFYDWLWAGANRVIGITWFCFEEFYFLTDLFAKLPYANVAHTRSGHPFFRIFFAVEGRSNYESAGDQDFGYNWLFESTPGQFAVSFGASHVMKFFPSSETIEEICQGPLRENSNTVSED